MPDPAAPRSAPDHASPRAGTGPSTRLAVRRLAEARDVAQVLQGAGYETLLCGGAVRDRLLGRVPKDIDLATAARPEEGARLFPEAVMVGAQFGVMVVPRPHGAVEVATFRADGCYVDGRRPDGVTFSDPPTDAARRDFTVNALFEDPETGRIHDHVGGRRDLEARLLRTIGVPGERFDEDHLRILRAVRFAVQLDFAIEPATWAAVRDRAHLVAGVAAERVRDELLKILRYGRGRGLRLLRDAGLLTLLLPEVAAMQGVSQPPNFHPEGDVFVHTCLVLDGVVLDGVVPEEGVPDQETASDRPPSETAAGDEVALPRDLAEDAALEGEREIAEEALLLSALLHDVAKPPTRTVDTDGRIRFNGHDRDGVTLGDQIMGRLRMRNRVRDQVGELVGQHMRIAATPSMRAPRLRRFLARPDLELHLRLHAADTGASHGDLRILKFLHAERARYENEPAVPPPLLGGRELLAMGYAPGRHIGEMLRWVQDEQLEGRLSDADQAARAVRDRYPVPPSEPAGEPPT